jgi:hypothetical protein
MFDAITPSRIQLSRPGHSDVLIAGYVDGHWPSHFEAKRLFPACRHVSIAVFADDDAQVLDVELMDATPAQAVPWAARQRRRGQVPTVYCNTSTWPAVVAEFRRAGARLPVWWAANYNNGPVIPAGAIGVQWKNTPGYDQSIVSNYWPGVDPPSKPGVGHPVKPPPHQAAQRHTVHTGETLSGIAAGWKVTLAALEHANPHAGHPAGNFDVIWPGDVLVHP